MFDKVVRSLLVCGLFAGVAMAKESKKVTNKTDNIKKETAAAPFVKPSDDELKKQLSDAQFKVARKNGTEMAFRNEYWDNKEPGIYVDVVKGKNSRAEPLFTSIDKFDSGTGWPSFTRPVADSHVTLKTDGVLMFKRTEVRSKQADSHLGHVFDDGPAPTGKRYCMNSAAMRFIPADKLASEGYEDFVPLFANEIENKKKAKEASNMSGREMATLAGGCFWGVEEIIQGIPGVVSTKVGYIGGIADRPTYEKVKKGTTGHAEAIQIIFDPSKLSYEALLVYFFRLHDPTTPNRQGNDVGTQYRSAIFFHSPGQKATAEKVIADLENGGKWKKKIVTEVVDATDFYDAEEYHQKYLKKNPGGYTCHYLREF